MARCKLLLARQPVHGLWQIHSSVYHGRPEKTIILAAGRRDLAEGKFWGISGGKDAASVTVLLEVSGSPPLLQNCTFTVIWFCRICTLLKLESHFLKLLLQIKQLSTTFYFEMQKGLHQN